MLTDYQEQVLALVRGGLWGTETDRGPFERGKVSWKRVYFLAKEQTMLGIVGDGLERLANELLPSKKVMLRFVMMVTRYEQMNHDMNAFVGQMVREFPHFVLLKGQEVGLCYRNPLRRVPGDIDAFVGFEQQDFERGKEAMTRMATYVGPSNERRRHAEFWVGKIPVEVHGNLRFCVSKACDRVFPDWIRERIEQDGCATVTIGDGEVRVLRPNVDVLFVFTHMLNHFMQGGVGLRQVMDWMMCLYHHRNDIDTEQLVVDVRLLGLEKFWLPFAALAVGHLGYPKEEMPLYDEQYARKGTVVLEHIFKTGNFGAKQKEKQLDSSHGKWKKKIVTFWGQIPVYWHNVRLFPRETWYCFCHYVRSSTTG